MPERLLARYQESQEDPDILSHQDDLALVDARIADLLGRTEEGEAGGLWRGMRASFHSLQVAINQKNAVSVLGILATMDSILEQGEQGWAAWDEIKSMLELRRRLAEGERKRLVEMQHVVKVEEVATLVMVIADIIRRNVDDPRVQMKVITELNRILTITRAGVGSKGGDAGADAALRRLVGGETEGALYEGGAEVEVMDGE